MIQKGDGMFQNYASKEVHLSISLLKPLTVIVQENFFQAETKINTTIFKKE